MRTTTGCVALLALISWLASPIRSRAAAGGMVEHEGGGSNVVSYRLLMACSGGCVEEFGDGTPLGFFLTADPIDVGAAVPLGVAGHRPDSSARSFR